MFINDKKIKKIANNEAEISEDENRRIQLDILKYVDEFCEKNGIRYFLGDGSLLGAIRHQGFIPWDDDIDIRVPRPDCYKMIELFNEYSKDSPYQLIDPKNKASKHFYNKIIDTRTIKIEKGVDYSTGFLGVDIDILPLDGSPEDEEQFKKWANELRMYNKAFSYKKKTVSQRTLSSIKDIIKRRIRSKRLIGKTDLYIINTINNLADRYSYDSSKYVSIIGIVDCFRIPRSCFSDYIRVPFEDGLFRIPIGYSQILNTQYGDYMTLPPVEQQVTHHSNKVYWKNY